MTKETFISPNKYSLARIGPVAFIGLITAIINFYTATSYWSSLDWAGWEGYKSMGRAFGIAVTAIFATIFPAGVFLLFNLTKLNFVIQFLLFLLISILAAYVNWIACEPVQYIMRYHY